MATLFQGIVIGVAVGTISTILASKLTNSGSTAPPAQPDVTPNIQPSRSTLRHGKLKVTTPWRSPEDAAPVVQNTPITEASYNQYPTKHETTLGPDQNQPNTEAVLPI
jgi:hypothetical protein